MKNIRWLSRIVMVVVIGFVALPAYLALAWPEQPPEKATISGPGIRGVVAITDKEALAALRLGVMEDLQTGVIAAPQVGEGYEITRYFYGGTFDFARLHYYPTANSRGTLYFEDGPQMSGDHTPYHQKWLYATAQGDAAMQKLLAQLVPSKSASQGAMQPEVMVVLSFALLIVIALVGGRRLSFLKSVMRNSRG